MNFRLFFNFVLFIVVGVFAGIMMCMVAMLVRCVLWYEKRHPEDDYWRRLAPPGLPDAEDKGGG